LWPREEPAPRGAWAFKRSIGGWACKGVQQPREITKPVARSLTDAGIPVPLATETGSPDFGVLKTLWNMAYIKVFVFAFVVASKGDNQ
jgi:hypothetical protein